MDQHIYDLAIIGGGPAGAAAAVYAARKRLKTVFITKDWLGQSNVSEKIENWIGTVAISGLDLSQSLEKHAKTYSDGIIDFKESEKCIAINRNPLVQPDSGSTQSFSITTDKGTYQSKSVLITSGSHRRKLDVPGAEKYDNKGLTYCATCDGPLFKNQDVAVIGGGNAGFESAAQLLAYCRSVTLLIRGDTFKADPETIDKVTSNPKMKVIKFAVPKEVKGDKFVTSFVYNDAQTKKDVEIPVTGIFVEIGSLPNTDFAKEIIELNDFGHVVTDAKNQRTSENGIWAAGDCTDGLYHQNNIAVGDAVKAIEDIYSWLHAK
ncbi:MAG: FAD-dependent oxidoreductase [Candidatus Taylorbacteria bacterium]